MYRMLMLVVNEIRMRCVLARRANPFVVMRMLIIVGWYVAHPCHTNPDAANMEWFHFVRVRRL